LQLDSAPVERIYTEQLIANHLIKDKRNFFMACNMPLDKTGKTLCGWSQRHHKTKYLKQTKENKIKKFTLQKQQAEAEHAALGVSASAHATLFSFDPDGAG